MAIQFSDPAQRKKPLSTFSLAGLTDIVLLLLVFFLLTSNFIPQFGIRVNLPRLETSASTEPRQVTVVITEDERYYVNQDLVSKDALLDAIAAAKDDRSVLVLRADQRATVGQFANVAGIARALGMTVLMATEPER